MKRITSRSNSHASRAGRFLSRTFAVRFAHYSAKVQLKNRRLARRYVGSVLVLSCSESL